VLNKYQNQMKYSRKTRALAQYAISLHTCPL